MINSLDIDLPIFVGGTASRTAIADVYSYFRSFGSVRSLAFVGSTDGIRRNIRLTMDGVKSYRLVPGYRGHVLDSRSLTCSPYIGGKLLIRMNARANKRKVVFKGIPAMISKSDVQEYLEAQAGPVELLFNYLPENNRNLYVKRRFNTYSVRFRDQQSANHLISCGELRLLKYCISIEVEKIKYKKSTRIESTRKNKTEQDNQKSIESSILLMFFSF